MIALDVLRVFRGCFECVWNFFYDTKDILEEVYDDDIFEKVLDDVKDILEKLSDDGNDIFETFFDDNRNIFEEVYNDGNDKFWKLI